MTVLMYFLIGLMIPVVCALLWKPIREYFRMRGDRVITCPDNEQPAAVTVNAGHAARTAAGGHEQLRLDSCSRWPEKAGCGQDCLKQIEAQPMDCLVKTQVSRWYTDKTCALCGKALGMIDWTERKPALRSPDGRTIEWQDVRPETLHQVMATHAAICWDCHVAETFRRERPDLVIDNPHATQPRP
ncbi:MAG: hypothetical protein NTY02_00435 [Acidobacteria bacterium]|nr:hypothetical protein [Acidobacteriota bacterium]